MKTMKKMGFASIAGAALAVLAPTAAIADTSQPAATNTTGSLVHRVSHALATTQQYTVGETGTGYKWDTGEAPAAPKSAWADSRQQKSTGGSKWGQSKASEQTRNPWGRASSSEQARNPWGRASTSEQARNPWGRASTSEQARNPWGRASTSEQTRNPWGRASTSEQARNPWGRASTSEQARNPWGRG